MTAKITYDSPISVGHRQWLAQLVGRTGDVTLADVEAAEGVVNLSGVLAKVPAWRAEDRADTRAGGANVIVTDRACLVILMILATESTPLHATRMAQMVHKRFTPDALAYLELERFGTYEQWYDRTLEAFKRFLAVVDPYPGPRRGWLTAAELKRVLDARDPEKMARKQERLAELTAALLHATFLMIPREHRRAWKGNTCIDATFMAAFGKRGTKKDKSFIGIEYDAGWYYHAGNHSEADRDKGDNGRNGWEIHLITMVANLARTEAQFPLLILGASTDTPSGRIAENALSAYSSMVAQFDASQEPPQWYGYAMGDRAYFAGTKAEKLQIPLRQLGFGILMDYKKDQLGEQTSDPSGALLVDGTLYCPTMPRGLIDATLLYREGEINRKIYRDRIKERARYQAVRKAAPDPDGYTRWMHPTVENGHVCDPNRENAPRFCTQKSVTVSPTAVAKLGQDLPHGSSEWKAFYNMGRNTIEGWNAILKDDARYQLGSAGRRRVRGRTAAHVSVILLIVAANLEKIEKFLALTENEKRAAAVHARKSRRKMREFDPILKRFVELPAEKPLVAARC